MRRRSRTRRVLKWVGLTVCLLILVVWAASLYVEVSYLPHPMFFLEDGHFIGNNTGIANFSLSLATRENYGLTGPSITDRRHTIPLWLPLAIVAIVTALLWSSDHGPPERRCRQSGDDVKRRFRTRHLLGWVGLSACLLFLVMWVTSLCVTVAWDPSPAMFVEDGKLTGTNDAFGEFYISRATRHDYGLTWPRSAGRFYWIPLWLPLVLVAIATAILWYVNRRPPKGHCRNCGYDLTGNVTGVCPECGQAI